jgi:spore maturation protein CgeB
MKLLLVGSDHIWSLEKIYYKYLKELQVDLQFFPAQNYFYSYYNRSVLNKIIYRSGISGIINKINKQLREAILHFKPGIVWVFKGMEILPSTLEWMKTQNIILVNYNPDNPFIFSSVGSGNKNIKQSIFFYDLHFTYDHEIKKQLEMKGCNTAMLPFGFDLNETLYKDCCNQKEIIKTCFLGNPDKHRADFLKSLAEKGLEIDIYGHHWDKFIHHPNVNLFAPVYGDDFWKTLYKYRVQLNLMRVHNNNSHNMRSFEIPGVGAIMLAPDTPDHRLFFEDNQEVYLFNDLLQCAKKIDNILILATDEANKIRHAARDRSLNSGYAYEKRTALVLEKLLQLNAKNSNYSF